jgi:hypothetical protein
MREPMDDTTSDAREVLFDAYSRMSPAEKIERMRQLTLMANSLALTGLRERHPDESEGMLLLRLARLRLGAELTQEIYGFLPSDP